MKLNRRFLSGCLLLGLAFDIPTTSAESAWQDPVIQGYGRVHPMPEAAVQPNPDREYKILFNITKAAGAPDQVNPGLEHAPWVINIFALQAVKKLASDIPVEQEA